MLKPGWDPCFTPDGAQIALVQRDDPYLRQAVYLVNLDGSGMRKITAGFAPRFSPDGTALLCSRWYSIDDQGQPGACGLVIHLLSGADAGSEFAMTADQQTTREYNGTFTPDGQQLLFDETMLVHNGARLMEGPGKGIFLMDRNRRNVLRLLNDGATQPTMTPDGADVFYLQENTLYYWVRKTGDTHRLTSGLNIQHYTFTPDGKHIILLAW